MGVYASLKKEFKFLANTYDFEISLKQKHGSYYFIVWSNAKINIMVLYDLLDEVPISIRVYDADSFSFDATEYKNEFEQDTGIPRERIRRAAEWLQNAIEDKRIIV